MTQTFPKGLGFFVGEFNAVTVRVAADKDR
jgi:hypothetical protein